MRSWGCYACAALLLATSGAVQADARTDYYQRAAKRDMTEFAALDRDQSGSLTRTEVMGDNDFSPRFNDIDINRDGIVTREEMQRYIREHYGVEPPAS
ncbi:MAG: EF-hand domain-containing protein [Betaproteobacteria bacterium]|jgi:Ca2+-binding EF-hand superfamily protein